MITKTKWKLNNKPAKNSSFSHMGHCERNVNITCHVILIIVIILNWLKIKQTVLEIKIWSKLTLLILLVFL